MCGYTAVPEDGRTCFCLVVYWRESQHKENNTIICVRLVVQEEWMRTVGNFLLVRVNVPYRLWSCNVV